MSQHNPPVRPAPPSSSPLICCSSPKPSEPYSASISSVRRQQAVQSEPGGHSSLRLASTGTVHPASVAVQSSIPTIPCIIFNQLILPCYLFPMFACTEPRSANQNLSLQFTLGPVPLTPLFATHRSSTQATENPNTLSPFLATHTDLSPVSPLFATHTKTVGVYTNNSYSGTSSSSFPKSAGLSFHVLTNCYLFVTEKQLLHFHALMNCYSRNSFLLIFHASHGGV